MAVPLFDTSTPLAPLRTQLAAKAVAILEGGSYILAELRAFEGEFAGYLGAKHAIGVANGTDALMLALQAMGVEPGDDVVVPSFSFFASAEAIAAIGARPVFCDIDLETFCVTPETVAAALTPKTKAVIVVHLFGNIAPVREIEALGVPVLEDAAQAAGSYLDSGGKAGALGTAAAFSFFPSKNLGCFGDGGAVITNNDALNEQVRMLRSHGSRDKQDFVQIGRNSRLDELQAGLLRLLLPELDGWSEGRRAAGRGYYEAGLGDSVTLPTASKETQPAWHLYVIRHQAADRLSAELTKQGIGNKGYYRTPIHRQPAMKPYLPTVELPVTEEAAATHLAIPIGPTLTGNQVEEVTEAVARCVSG